MKADFLIKNFPKTQILEEYFLKEVEKIQKRLAKRTKMDSVHLRCQIEKNSHKEEYTSQINLHLPKKVMKAEEKERLALSSLKKSFRTIKGQLDRYFKKRESFKERKDS